MADHKHEHWRVTVEANGEHIVSIEPEMLAGRETSEADDHAIRTAARHLLAFVGDATGDNDIPVPDAVIATVWRAAMTVAVNVVIKRQNDLNDDDGPTQVLEEQGDCIKALKSWLDVDEVYLEELRPMVRAALPPSPLQRTKR